MRREHVFSAQTREENKKINKIKVTRKKRREVSPLDVFKNCVASCQQEKLM